MAFEYEETVYENQLAEKADVEGFIMEGEAGISFPNGRMQMVNNIDPAEGQKSNFVFWCPEEFPDNIEISWDFYPLREPGLCILFFAAKGQNGKDLFDPDLAERTGEFRQYTNGNINTLHASYFRRKQPQERAFQTCNLRKNAGCNLVMRGGDPLPGVEDADPPYRIRIIKYGPEVNFYINDLQIYQWLDDGKTYGPVYKGGRIGFRQMAPLKAEYSNLTVKKVKKTK